MKNIDDKYKIENMDIEEMLKPQCDFHASEKVMKEVIEEAKRMRKPSTVRLWPWVAAASVACLLIMHLVPTDFFINQNTEEGHFLAAPLTTDTTHNNVAKLLSMDADKNVREADTLENAAVYCQNVTNEKEEKSVYKEYVEKRTDVAHKNNDSESAPQQTEMEDTKVTIVGAMPMRTVVNGNMPAYSDGEGIVINERDLPVHRPQNLRYTERDKELLRQIEYQTLIQKAMNEIEIAKYQLSRM